MCRNLIVLLFVIIEQIFAANILGIYFHGGKSHHILGEMLFKELARRGHNVTMASPFPLKQPFPNYTDIHLTGILEDQLSREAIFMKMNQGGHKLAGVDDFLNLTRTQTELTLKHTEIDKLIKSGTKFDVVIMDWLVNYALLVFGHVFDAPIIIVASLGNSHYTNGLTANVLPTSFVPNIMLELPSNMTFFQRVSNTVFTTITSILGFSSLKYHNNLIKKYYPNAPDIDVLKRNIALVLANGHYSFETPRPYMPNVIPVGGFHVQRPKKLPKDLQLFMDQATQGVIYFSLGSNMKSVLLPKQKQDDILKVFSRLPYKVLWKWEDQQLSSNKPANVMIKNWLPQNDILAHPNLKLFISHGGLLSTIESVYHGIPVLGIPIFGDQKSNIMNAVRAGYAQCLDLADLNESTLERSLTEILENSKYDENAKRRSKLLHDQPITPMENAVFWVEHVVRHKGAPHLQSHAINLTWYEFWAIDVVIFITFIISMLTFIIYLVIKAIITFISNNSRKIKVQ